jgi:hypothetical protein
VKARANPVRKDKWRRRFTTLPIGGPLRLMAMKTHKCLLLWLVILSAWLRPAQAQQISQDSKQGTLVIGSPTSNRPVSANAEMPLIPCPGSFPTDLTAVNNCKFTTEKRLAVLTSGSLTDQAMGSAAFYALVAQIWKSPDDWHRTWEGYGLRVGVRYKQSVAKGSTQFLVGWIMRDDPRHVSYRDDPRHYTKYLAGAQPSSGDAQNSWAAPSGCKRLWHAIFDSLTVRRSSEDGLGRRIPALSRFAGDFGGAYATYAWYRGPQNTFGNVGLRVAGAFGGDVVSSLYTEFKPAISKKLGELLNRGNSRK